MKRLAVLMVALLTLAIVPSAVFAEQSFNGYRRNGDRLPPPVFSPDGSLLAVANYYDIHLRRVPAYELVSTIPMPNGRVGGLAFMPDGRLLAGDVNGALAVFRPGQTTPEKVYSLPVPVHALAVSPDGRHIALSGNMGSASRTMVLDAHTLQQLFEIPKNNAWHVAFLDNERLVSVEDKVASYLMLISLSQRKVVAMKRVPDAILGVAHNRSDGILYLGSRPRLRLLDAATLRDIISFQDPVRPNPVSAVGWHDQSRLLVTAEGEGPLSVRDSATGAILHRLYGHNDRPEQLVIAPDGSRIISITGPGELTVWSRDDFKPFIRGTMLPPAGRQRSAADPVGRMPGMKVSWKRGGTDAGIRLPGEKKIRAFAEGVHGIEAWGGDDRQFCVAGTAHRTRNTRTDLVELRDSVTLETILKKSHVHEHSGAHGGKLLAMICRDRETVLLLATTSLTVFRGGGRPAIVIPQRGNGNNQFTTMALSPNGRYLAVAERLGVVRVIRTADYGLEQMLFTDWGLPGPVALSISDQGEVEATVEDGNRYLWKIGQGGADGS